VCANPYKAQQSLAHISPDELGEVARTYSKTLDRVIASAERQGRGPYTNFQYCLTAYHMTEQTRGYTPCIVGR
jgi:hypothetical protein